MCDPRARLASRFASSAKTNGSSTAKSGWLRHGDEPVGLVCLGLHDEDPETGEVFGLWTTPPVRGERAAWGLVPTAAQKAAEGGCRLLCFWASSDNGFASSFGFRPTAERRPVRGADGAAEKDADEVAMVLPLSTDPTQSATLTWGDRPTGTGRGARRQDGQG